MGAESGCQRLLTGGEASKWGVLDECEGGVRLQEVADDLSALHLQLVVTQAASKSRMEASAGPDGRERVSSGVLEGGEGLVLLQTLGKVLSGLGVEVVVCQTANASRIHVSAGLDGKERAASGVLEGGEGAICLETL